MKRKTKERNIRIDNWEELCIFLEDMNPYKETIVWSGFVNKIDEETGRLRILSLYFTVKPIEILKK